MTISRTGLVGVVTLAFLVGFAVAVASVRLELSVDYASSQLYQRVLVGAWPLHDDPLPWSPVWAADMLLRSPASRPQRERERHTVYRSGWWADYSGNYRASAIQVAGHEFARVTHRLSREEVLRHTATFHDLVAERGPLEAHRFVDSVVRDAYGLGPVSRPLSAPERTRPRN